MGGRVGVSKEDVFKACDKLFESGFDVTNPNVRKELGGGSYSTISPLVDQWKDAKATESVNKIETPTMPKAVADLATKFAEQIWAESSLIGFKKIAEIEKLADAKAAELQARVESKDQELKQTQTDIQKVEKQLEETSEMLQKTQIALQQKEGEIALLKEQLSGKDGEIKNLLERAIRAEKDADALKKK